MKFIYEDSIETMYFISEVHALYVFKYMCTWFFQVSLELHLLLWYSVYWITLYYIINLLLQVSSSK
jgi:hypothetical protein